MMELPCDMKFRIQKVTRKEVKTFQLHKCFLSDNRNGFWFSRNQCYFFCYIRQFFANSHAKRWLRRKNRLEKWQLLSHEGFCTCSLRVSKRTKPFNQIDYGDRSQLRFPSEAKLHCNNGAPFKMSPWPSHT